MSYQQNKENESLSLDEIAEILLDHYDKKIKENKFSGFLVGITGSSGAGKTTLSLDLQTALQKKWPNRIITVVQADNFIYPNAWLDAHQLMDRKGFPESFNFQALKSCLEAIRSSSLEEFPLWMPYYSQDIKDIHPNKKIALRKSDIYILEGVNLFFEYEKSSPTSVRKWLDFCIYLDTDKAIIKDRAIKRFLDAYEKSKVTPTPYFDKFIGWPDEKIKEHAEILWKRMDMDLLKNYIEPHKLLANLLLKRYTYN